MSRRFRRCEICGSDGARLFLRSARLDGPLVRCPVCGHLFVGARGQDYTFGAADPERSSALAAQVQALAIVDPAVEQDESPGLRRAAQTARLERLCAQVSGGRLLDVGSALGRFLEVAAERFTAEGVEPDPATAAQARARGLTVANAGLAEVVRPPGGYDAVTMYHLIEHLDSPRAGLLKVREIIADRGVLVIETPTVDSAFFRLAPARWRQLIPDHYHFFSQATLVALLEQTGWNAVGHVKVGRRVSLRFAADRWRRAGLPGAARLSGASARCTSCPATSWRSPRGPVEGRGPGGSPPSAILGRSQFARSCS
jgi:2-polyprenyl-3-methyl-5-hydroxy-6-metoxy-1,4-benzoquinol methylase